MIFSYRGGAFGEAAEPNIFYILGFAACHMVGESTLIVLQNIDSSTLPVPNA